MGTFCYKEKPRELKRTESEEEILQKFLNHIKTQIPNTDEELQNFIISANVRSYLETNYKLDSIIQLIYPKTNAQLIKMSIGIYEKLKKLQQQESKNYAMTIKMHQQIQFILEQDFVKLKQFSQMKLQECNDLHYQEAVFKTLFETLVLAYHIITIYQNKTKNNIKNFWWIPETDWTKSPSHYQLKKSKHEETMAYLYNQIIHISGKIRFQFSVMYAKMKKDELLSANSIKKFQPSFAINSLKNQLDQKIFDKDEEKLKYKEDSSTTILVMNQKFNKPRCYSAEIISNPKQRLDGKLKLMKHNSDHKLMKRNTLDQMQLHQIQDQDDEYLSN